MESLQSIKRRLKGAQNIGTITKAMELVEVTKMRKSQEYALNSRPYSYAALGILGIVSKLKEISLPELLCERPIKKTAFLLIASDKGLAGSFNSAVIRKFESFARAEHIDISNEKYSFIVVGQKARTYCERRNLPILQSFNHMGDSTRTEEVKPISDYLAKGYLNGDFDEVILFSTSFVTALRQDPIVRRIFPITFEKIKRSIEETIPQAGRYSHYIDTELLAEQGGGEYLIEPSPKEALEELAPKLLDIWLYHLMLEANASEHSARRVAMKNASENAEDLSEKLNVVYNKSRQAAITNAIIEVTSGAGVSL
jgi:F-type H+-transporting ATPase subunit gamma